MAPSHSIPELIAAARITAKVAEYRALEILEQMDGQGGTDGQVAELRATTKVLELQVVDTFSIFEARMQHHFRRGPFSRKLKALLVEACQSDLADRFHEYYLIVNVLKHGKGASYRELLNAPTSPFVVKMTENPIEDEPQDAVSLVDVSVAGFFDGLAATILEAYDFLESK